MTKRAWLILALLPTFAFARMGGETITATNSVVHGLSFTVSYTQQIDVLRVDLRVSQTDGDTTVIGKMGGSVSLGRKLMVSAPARLEGDTATVRFFIAPEELTNVIVSMISSSSNSAGITGGCIYQIDVASFINQKDSEQPLSPR